MEFWNEMLVKASWEKLIELAKEIDLILIGGWSAYLWTGLHKSKDIDIIINYNTLFELQKKYSIGKNDSLKKYEIKFDKFDVDVYLPKYSELSFPIEKITKENVIKVKGIKTVIPEILLILKQGAEIERRNSIKGQKDSIDILTLLIHSSIDFKKYFNLLKECKKEHYLEELKAEIKNFDDKNLKYLNIDFAKFKKWKKKVFDELKNLK